MPALPNVAGALKVQQGWSEVSDTGAMTVFHLAYTGGPPSAAQCATMAATIQGHAVTRFAGLLHTGSVVGLAPVPDLNPDMGRDGTPRTRSSRTRPRRMRAHAPP